jgi:hypothetical protein
MLSRRSAAVDALSPERRRICSLAGTPPPRRRTAPLVSTSLSLVPTRGAHDDDKYSVEWTAGAAASTGMPAVLREPAPRRRSAVILSAGRPWCEVESGSCEASKEAMRGFMGRAVEEVEATRVDMRFFSSFVM